MQNDYNNKQGQSTVDKASEFARSAGPQIEQKGKDMAGDAQKMIKEEKEKIGKVLQAVDKQVRENPWLAIAGVAVGAFLLASVINRSNK